MSAARGDQAGMPIRDRVLSWSNADCMGGQGGGRRIRVVDVAVGAWSKPSENVRRQHGGAAPGGVGWYLCTGAAPAADEPGCGATVRAVQMDNGSHAAVNFDWGGGGAAGRGRIDAETAQMLLGALGNSGTQCPACENIIQKIDGDATMMCGCEARPAGGTMEKALAGGGCGHEFNFATGDAIGQGAPGNPANDRQWKFAVRQGGLEHPGGIAVVGVGDTGLALITESRDQPSAVDTAARSGRLLLVDMTSLAVTVLADGALTQPGAVSISPDGGFALVVDQGRKKGDGSARITRVGVVQSQNEVVPMTILGGPDGEVVGIAMLSPSKVVLAIATAGRHEVDGRSSGPPPGAFVAGVLLFVGEVKIDDDTIAVHDASALKVTAGTGETGSDYLSNSLKASPDGTFVVVCLRSEVVRVNVTAAGQLVQVASGGADAAGEDPPNGHGHGFFPTGRVAIMANPMGPNRPFVTLIIGLGERAAVTPMQRLDRPDCQVLVMPWKMRITDPVVLDAVRGLPVRCAVAELVRRLGLPLDTALHLRPGLLEQLQRAAHDMADVVDPAGSPMAPLSQRALDSLTVDGPFDGGLHSPFSADGVSFVVTTAEAEATSTSVPAGAVPTPMTVMALSGDSYVLAAWDDPTNLTAALAEKHPELGHPEEMEITVPGDGWRALCAQQRARYDIQRFWRPAGVGGGELDFRFVVPLMFRPMATVGAIPVKIEGFLPEPVDVELVLNHPDATVSYARRKISHRLGLFVPADQAANGDQPPQAAWPTGDQKHTLKLSIVEVGGGRRKLGTSKDTQSLKDAGVIAGTAIVVELSKRGWIDSVRDSMRM